MQKLVKIMGSLDMVVHTCNSSTWKAEAGGLEVHGQHCYKRELEVSHWTPCLKVIMVLGINKNA